MNKIAISILIIYLFVFNLYSQEKLERVSLGKNVNSLFHEIKPIISPDGKNLYFIRANHPENRFGKDESQDIWLSNKNNNGEWQKAVHLEHPFNQSKFNGILGVSPDGLSVMISGAYKGGELVTKGYSMSSKTIDGWSVPEALNIKMYDKMNVGIYSGAFMAADQKVLLLSFSEKIDGKLNDLYVSFKDINKNRWSKPMKLPDVINSKSTDEISPYLAADGKTLYFASNRKGGFGSMDIWVTKRLDRDWKKWSEPVNLGSEINSEKWEGYYTMDATGETAFIVGQNPDNKKGDIYELAISEEMQPDPVVLISGKVYDSKTRQLLSAKITYHILSTGNEVGAVNSSPIDGTYKIVLPYGEMYSFSANLKGYFAVSDNIDLTNVSEYKELNRDLFLAPIEVGQTVRLNNIFFDTGKSELRKESFPELDRVIKLMIENKNMQILISGHTDNIGNDNYNLNLSTMRANAVMNYLLKKGIKENRVKAKGYGEKKPVSTNDTEKGRQQNRRVEFTIEEN